MVENNILGCVVYKDDEETICEVCDDEYRLNRDKKLCIRKSESSCLYYNYL